MKAEERHAKMSEAVLQIGKLTTACSQAGLDQDDMMLILQTATSLMCEMNDVPIEWYIKFLYVVHKKRLVPGYDGEQEEDVLKQLVALFTPDTTGATEGFTQH